MLGDHPSPLADAVRLNIYAAEGAHAVPTSAGATAVRRRLPPGVPARPRRGVDRAERVPDAGQRVRRRPVGGRARSHRPLPLPRRPRDDARRRPGWSTRCGTAGRSRSACRRGGRSCRRVGAGLAQGRRQRRRLRGDVVRPRRRSTSRCRGASASARRREHVGAHRRPGRHPRHRRRRRTTAVRWAATTVTLEVRVRRSPARSVVHSLVGVGLVPAPRPAGSSPSSAS